PEQYVTVYIAIDDGKPGKDFPAAAGGSGYGYSGYPGGLVMGRSNYLGVGGFFAPSYASYASPKYAQYYAIPGCFDYKSHVSLTQITDGTSNTFMFMEYIGANQKNYGGGIPDGWAGASWSLGFLYTWSSIFTIVPGYSAQILTNYQWSNNVNCTVANNCVPGY